jgi:hypothetical protein
MSGKATSQVITALGPDDLRLAGEALFGSQWQTDLCSALQLSSTRRTRQWLSRERGIPASIWPEIVRLLEERAGDALAVRDALVQKIAESQS